MWLDVHGQGVAVGPGERERARRRLGFALARFGDHVGRVTVNLTGGSGPAGGAEVRCRVVVEVLGHARVAAEVADPDPGAAIDRAADRAGLAVRRQLDRARLYAGPPDPRPPAPN